MRYLWERRVFSIVSGWESLVSVGEMVTMLVPPQLVVDPQGFVSLYWCSQPTFHSLLYSFSTHP